MSETLKPNDVLKQYWGYDAFRPLQEDIIQATLDGQDSLALMPTGGGKSICFQVPALCQEGICIVVSPLIALMKDQVQNLMQRDIPAVAIYSGMRFRDIDRTLDNCVYGNYKFLYLSPERLTTDIVRERLQRMNVNLLAVDEAHCISQWGYDFRPPYLEIANIRELLPKVSVLALTATATPEVVKDIQDKLAFTQPQVFQKSFSRSNLSYSVLKEENKAKKLLQIIRNVKGSGIIYVRSRNRSKELAEFLQRQGFTASYYHAGLNSEQRSKRQEAWMKDKVRIMVSTNAFGMGIDKPDVRLVVHIDLPDSLEAYFQEAGRAGRDGAKAYAVMLYNDSDRQSLERKFEASFPPMETIRKTYQALGHYCQLATGGGEGQSFNFDITDFARTYQLDTMSCYHSLRILEQAGWIVLTDAIYIPSSLMVKVSKEKLYDYQLRHRKFDLILKTILRNYQGAFQNYVKIRESQLARFLKMPRQELSNALRILQQDGIINYKPQKDDPQLIFLHERIPSENLTIDMAMYDFRKNRQMLRIRSSIAYVEDVICRSRQLLSYFGETAAENCGICDVCLGRTRAEISTEEFERLKGKIRRLLKDGPLKVEEIIDSFSPKRSEQVLKALEYLIDEGLADRENDRLSWKK
ncbi:MAG: ATP-dependent DNA helicase RecQ [Bacteroidota bacterium]